MSSLLTRAERIAALHRAAAERILVQRCLHQIGMALLQRLAGIVQLAIDRAQRIEHLRFRHHVAIVAEHLGQRRIH